MFLKSAVVLLALAVSLTRSTNSHIGLGTVFTQQGGTGSCGRQNPDSSFIVALSNSWMQEESPSPLCGRKIKATNVGSDDGVGGAGNSVIVTVADTCPSCNEDHPDFSVGAWNRLTDSAPFGTIKVNW
jgi:hypothetical protein